MPSSVLLLGATGGIGALIAGQLSSHRHQFDRVAFLTAIADAGPEKEAKYKAVPLPRIVGALDDPASYNGFDIVVSSVNDLEGAQIRYIDAAFAGGIKHFYPAEFGMDLTRPEIQEESFFARKLNIRKHLEHVVSQDPSRGFTYILVGMWSNWMLDFNIFGLSDDKKSATFVGAPDTLLTTTHAEDVASVTVLSLLPSHLKSLSERRHIRLAGSTLTISQYYSVLSKVLGHDINVQYVSKEASYSEAEDPKEKSNHLAIILASLKRTLGFGGSVLEGVDNDSYPEITVKSWEEVVKARFS
ncbi:Isoflavone reductase-like protein IRL [Psilocybe cubensis]|uniref:NmrA-like domain-containing protein n=2 Tax=Psilocybe cubensis TaxID=181762 RepID=A0A8H7XZV9_PSICU|nr:Isoflavone reductase-like protein IRL [Psilocybe cubensis]KAH9481224.1 Isoflavone reductase-like protein IRL [Psilocybe cubensis]